MTTKTKTTVRNARKSARWPIAVGESVLWLGREYIVAAPGSQTANAELRSRDGRIAVFVNAAEFSVED